MPRNNYIYGDLSKKQTINNKGKLTILKSKEIIIQYSSTVYRDHKGLGFLAPKYHPKNQLNIYFMTSRQDWLGIAKLKSAFRSTINPSMKLI